MPRPRRPDRQRIAIPISDNIWRWLVDESDGEGDFDIFRLRGDLFEHPQSEDRPNKLQQMVERMLPEILTYFVARNPGKRPRIWWAMYGEPRARLGGKGVRSSERWPALKERFECGLPQNWETLDPADLPRFESQAVYLKRCGLLLPGEARRLREADFAPEVVT